MEPPEEAINTFLIKRAIPRFLEKDVESLAADYITGDTYCHY